MVAFHFQLANEERAGGTGWDCDSCRKNGLEGRRRCGFLAEEQREPKRAVWGRRRVVLEECPRSYVTGESWGLLEEFYVRQRLGARDTTETDARAVDAFLILRDEAEREDRDGTAQH